MFPLVFMITRLLYFGLPGRPYGSAGSIAEKEAIAHEWAGLFSRNFALRIGMFGKDSETSESKLVYCWRSRSFYNAST